MVHFFFFLEVSQRLILVLFGGSPSPHSPWWLKIHSTLQVRVKEEGEKPAFDRECLKEEKASFQMLSEQSPGMWGQQHLEVFKHWSAAAGSLCCQRSKKLLPVISHLVTSRTSILLLLPPAVAVFFPLCRQMVPELLRWSSPPSPPLCSLSASFQRNLLCATSIEQQCGPAADAALFKDPRYAGGWEGNYWGHRDDNPALSAPVGGASQKPIFRNIFILLLKLYSRQDCGFFFFFINSFLYLGVSYPLLNPR